MHFNIQKYVAVLPKNLVLLFWTFWTQITLNKFFPEKVYLRSIQNCHNLWLDKLVQLSYQKERNVLGESQLCLFCSKQSKWIKLIAWDQLRDISVDDGVLELYWQDCGVTKRSENTSLLKPRGFCQVWKCLNINLDLVEPHVVLYHLKRFLFFFSPAQEGV